MVSFQFGDLPETTIQDGLVPIPKGKLNVNDPSSQEKRSKGLVPMTLKTGEVMWVHQDLVDDKQWDSNRPKHKGKSCNMISFALAEDDGTLVNSLTDSEEEQFVLEAQPARAQPTGTRSGKTYLRQYDQATEEAHQPSTSKDTATALLLAPTQPVEKGRPKDLRFSNALKKNSVGLDAPFRFDIMA